MTPTYKYCNYIQYQVTLLNYFHLKGKYWIFLLHYIYIFITLVINNLIY